MRRAGVTKQSPTKRRRSTVARWGWILLLCLPAPGAGAQPTWFGSADDPREQIQQVWWRRENTLDVAGGFSLIGPHWRFSGSGTADLVTKPLTGRLSATVRAGMYGAYRADFDELYDVLRTVEFVRYNPPALSPFYFRAGPIRRMRLGTGHVVNFYNSAVAWDERTIGLQSAWSSPTVDVEAFTDNVLLNGVTGGRLALRPLVWATEEQARSFTLGFNYVTDLGTYYDIPEPLSAYNVDVSFDALTSGAFQFTPFASFAWYANQGSGLSFGADLHSSNLIDLARFRLRMALYYNGRGFIPGYIGSFYAVSNPKARILKSEDYGDQLDPDELVGIRLAEAGGGNDLMTELRVLIFDRFEFWYAFRRHYGTESLSEYHLRLFARSPERLELSIGIDRGGLLGFLSLFNDIGDQTALVFDTQYRVAQTLWVFARARYTYERVGDGPDGNARFLVQRWFEPLSGLRLTF